MTAKPRLAVRILGGESPIVHWALCASPRRPESASPIRQPHPLQDRLEAGVGTERVEVGEQVDVEKRVDGAFLETPLSEGA